MQLKAAILAVNFPNSSGTPRHDEKSSATLPGRVEKVNRPIHPSQPEKAQISVDGADHLYIGKFALRTSSRTKTAMKWSWGLGQPWMWRSKLSRKTLAVLVCAKSSPFH